MIKSIEQLKKDILREISLFEKQAGELPSAKNFRKYEDIGALWVVSGAGSYLSAIIDSPSDKRSAKNTWYPGQDKARLDYALKWLHTFEKVCPSPKPVLVYNGTRKQNADLRKACREGIIDLGTLKLYIAPGEIAKTIDQVRKFSFPPSFTGKKLAVLSHSAHLPRILRFMRSYSGPFKNIEIVVLSVNVPNAIEENEMIASEVSNLLGYIARGEASNLPYAFVKETKGQDSQKSGMVEISPITIDDLTDIFRLSNQNSIRAMSFQQNKIELEEHKKWFKHKLEDKNTEMLKATVQGKLAGQVRLDLENKEALISISTSEHFRGMGVASKMLQGAIARAKKRGLKTINAFIKPDNQASIGLFEKNGWVFAGQEEESSVMANKYVYEL